MTITGKKIIEMEDAELKLLREAGQLLLELAEEVESESIDLNDLASGLFYYVNKNHFEVDFTQE